MARGSESPDWPHRVVALARACVPLLEVVGPLVLIWVGAFCVLRRGGVLGRSVALLKALGLAACPLGVLGL